jgi:hypothetical protein
MSRARIRLSGYQEVRRSCGRMGQRGDCYQKVTLFGELNNIKWIER